MLKNDRCIDMHIHSKASDGALTPEKCVQKAIEHGVSRMSIVDHDTIAAYKELKGRYDGVDIIIGVELSAKHDSELHILGYGFDKNDKAMNDLFLYMKNERLLRNKRIIEKLNKIGIPLDYNDLIGSYDSDAFGRVHIAKELVKNGHAQSVQDAFKKYLLKGGAAYCQRELPSKEKCIDAIKRSGGIAVLAHPIYLGYETQELIRFIGELIELGLEGVEAYHPAQNEAYCLEIIDICKKKHLYATAGTDTHGFAEECYAPPVVENEYVINCVNEMFACSR